MIITNFYLPGNDGYYKLIEEIDPRDGEVACRAQFWADLGYGEEEKIEKHCNFNSLAKEVALIVERDGWGAISPDVKGVFNRHPIIYQMIIGEVPNKVIKFVGVGQDGENLFLEKLSDYCFLLHAESNEQSPFEFESESDARQMIAMLAKFRVESRMMKELGFE